MFGGSPFPKVDVMKRFIPLGTSFSSNLSIAHIWALKEFEKSFKVFRAYLFAVPVSAERLDGGHFERKFNLICIL